MSERQLARIETAGDAASVRSNTLTSLARALRIDVQVLTGEYPLPDFAQEEPMLQINPETLKTLRRNKRMSRRELAKRADVSERHIARLESSRPSVRASTINRIAGALKTDKRTLTSDVGVNASDRQDVQVGLKVSSQLRLAYDLIGHRYGISRSQLAELAPLLFALMAEGCLGWRRECLKEVDSAMSRLRELSQLGQLRFASLLVDIDTGCGVEEDSIDKADLLGDIVRRDGYFSGSDYPNEVTPFADYLCKQAEDLDIDGIVDFSLPPEETFASVGFDTIWGAETYQVCRRELTELTGDSNIAKWALARGDVLLSKVPKQLMVPEAKDDRVRWLESKASEKTRELQENWEQFWAGLDQISVQLPASDEPGTSDAVS